MKRAPGSVLGESLCEMTGEPTHTGDKDIIEVLAMAEQADPEPAAAL